MSAPETFRWKTWSWPCFACTASISGLHTEKLCEVSRFVLERAKVTIPPNRPIVGDKLYEVESGIIAGWVRLRA